MLRFHNNFKSYQIIEIALAHFFTNCCVPSFYLRNPIPLKQHEGLTEAPMPVTLEARFQEPKSSIQIKSRQLHLKWDND